MHETNTPFIDEIKIMMKEWRKMKQKICVGGLNNSGHG